MGTLCRNTSQWSSFRPLDGPVQHHHQIGYTTWGKRPDQVHVYMREGPLWNLHGNDGRVDVGVHLGSLAMETLFHPAINVSSGASNSDHQPGTVSLEHQGVTTCEGHRRLGCRRPWAGRDEETCGSLGMHEEHCMGHH